MEETKCLKPSDSGSRIGDRASVQAATRVNAEQASKRTMCRPTRQPFRGRLIRPGEMSEEYAQLLHRGSGGSMYTRKAHATREAPDAQRGKAETMAAYGIPEADIARVLGVSKPTLRKHCGTELDAGATRANSKVADFLFYGICGGTSKPAFKDERARVTAAIFWMKTRGGWSETSTHKHTGVANGDPIEVEVVTVRERLTRRIARIAAASTT